MGRGIGGSTAIKATEVNTVNINDRVYFGQNGDNYGYMGINEKVTPDYPIDCIGVINSTSGFYINGSAVIDGSSLGPNITAASGLLSAPVLSSTSGLTMNGHCSANGNMNVTAVFTVGNIEVLSSDTLGVGITTSHLEYNDATLYNSGGITGAGDLSIVGDCFFEDVYTTGEMSVGGDTLFVDTVNNAIGINTLGPRTVGSTSNTTLGIESQSSTCRMTLVDGTSNNTFTMGIHPDTTSSGDSFIFTDNAFEIGPGMSSAMRLETDGQVSIGGNFQVDTDTFVVDSVNDRVGINVENPAYDLDVVGDINFSGVLRDSGTQILSSTTLGSGVVNSSLTSVGTLSSLNVSGKITIGGRLALTTMTTTAINALSSPSAGQVVFNTTLGKICVYNGTQWRKITDETM